MMSTRKKKPKWRALGDRCLLCRRKAVEGLACEKHRGAKVEMKHSALPYVILEQEKPERLTGLGERTLLECARCGYQLLTAEEAEKHLSAPPPRSVGGTIVGELLPKFVCKSVSDCARRLGDLVAGKRRVRACSKSLTV
jgi:hypothetical protein